MARIVGEPDGGPRRVEDYEATLAPIYAWIHAVAQVGSPGDGRVPHSASTSAWQALAGTGRASSMRRWRRRALGAGFPLLVAGLNRAGLGPVRSQLSGGELGRASLRAQWEVMARLGVEADYLIFGHTHRAGPLSAARADAWRGPQGRVAMNTGSWILEPAFLGPRPQSSPYRAGFCVVVDETGPPELRNLLDPGEPVPG
jgi:hypothetical protein